MLALLVVLAAATPAVAVEKSVLQQLQQKVLQDYERAQRVIFGGKTEAEYFAHIPAGSFRMGDTHGDVFTGAKPVHRVSVKAFLLSKTEVTYAQWDACVAAGGCSHNPEDYKGRGNKPVGNVSWNDVNEQYIPWLNKTTGKLYRLPTEAEWEYAARAGVPSHYKYSWGKTASHEYANYGDGLGGVVEGKDRWRHTAPVASFGANAFGLYDMHGNREEFTQDCWNGSYKGAPSDGSAWLSGDCSRRVVRGGSWRSHANGMRLYSRGWVFPNDRANSGQAGFRLSRTLD